MSTTLVDQPLTLILSLSKDEGRHHHQLSDATPGATGWIDTASLPWHWQTLCKVIFRVAAMRMFRRLACALLASIASLGPALADEYAAISNTAMSITGDISFDDFSIVFANGEELRFSDLVADHFVVHGKDVPASVYRIETPADPELENGNRLCGSGDVTYLANWSGLAETDSVIAVFTGEDEPTSDAEMCASYTYEMK